MMGYALLLLLCTCLKYNDAQTTAHTEGTTLTYTEGITATYTVAPTAVHTVTPTTANTEAPSTAHTLAPTIAHTLAASSAAPTGAATTGVPSPSPPPTCNRTHCPQECACTPQNLWLDIILVVDISNSMTAEGLLGAKGFLSSLIGALTVSQVPGRTTRLAIVGFAATTQVFQYLTDLNNTNAALSAINNIPYNGSAEVNIAGALIAAGDVIRQSDLRSNAKNVILLIASANQRGSSQDPHPIASQLKNEGNTIVTVAYTQSDTATPPNIDFASPGFNFSNKQPDIFPAMGRALCNVNCYCLPRWFQFVSGVPGGATYNKYGECLYPVELPATWDAARQVCTTITPAGGFLMDELNQDKYYFARDLAISMFPQIATQGYWIGLNNKNGSWSWDRGNQNSVPLDSNNDYSDWTPGYPVPGSAACVANIKYTGFLLKWRNLQCNSAFTDARVYLCQTRSCDTDNYCL